VDGWAGYAVGVPWALRERGFDVPGFDAAVDGYVPLGSGLSSSAALECAVAVALDDLAGLGLGGSDAGRAQLAAACVQAENDIAGAPTGGLDQAASLRCTARHALLLDCRDFSAGQVSFDPGAAGLELLVMDSRTHHALVDGQYGSRRQACSDAARLLGIEVLSEIPAVDLDDALAEIAAGVDDPEQADEMRRRVRHVVTEIARVEDVATLLRAHRLRAVGAVLDASHASLRDDFEVSCAELDLACETARAHGALGARMTGGGFGGSAIAVVEAGEVEAVAARVARAFEVAGLGAPAFLQAVPSAAAGPVLRPAGRRSAPDG
jgi:galactokinase